MYITAIFSSIFVFLYLRLTFHVIELRKMHRVSLGSGGIEILERGIRAHANFSEYAPIALILMGILEFNRAPLLLVSFLGIFIFLGRYFHAKGMIGKAPNFDHRVVGMKFTLVGLALLALSNVI